MCHACAEQLRAPWLVNTKLDDQPRYQSSVNCHWWPIFEGLNDWTVASLVPGKKGEEDQSDDIFEAQNLFLDAMARQAQSDIVVGGVGAFATEDPNADGYYLVKWVDEPRTLDEDLSLVKFEPPIVLKRGEQRVVRAKYYNKVPRATRWYTPSTTLLTTVRLQQVLVTNLEIHPQSTTSKLSNTCNKVAARSKGAQMINVNDHEKIVDKIARHEILDFYEEEDDEDEEEEEDDDDDEEDDNNDDKEEDGDVDI
jgi:hypothetical protein